MSIHASLCKPLIVLMVLSSKDMSIYIHAAVQVKGLPVIRLWYFVWFRETSSSSLVSQQ